MSTQITQITQIGVGHYVPVMPTEESQADKGIGHPLWSCGECDAVWRSHTISRCPICARHCGHHAFLDEEKTNNLMDAILNLDVPNPSLNEHTWDTAMWKFRSLTRDHMPWYNMNSRMSIQACYEELCASDEEFCERNPHEKVAFAISFFEDDYLQAPEEDATFCPEERHFQMDAQYDLMRPSW